MIDHGVQNTEQYEILIVDDTPDGPELLRRMLKEFGYRVRPAANGHHALKSVAARLPDLILLDVKMPEMDGYEVCRRLKSKEYSRNVPVLFISAHGETAKKVEGFKAGGVDFITKPFEREEVLARVETHLRLGNLTERLGQEVNQRTTELTLANQRLRQQMTERKVVEEALRRLNLELDRRVLERTTELEAANKEMHAFTYTVSHDLRAPLRHIDGFLELLKMQAGPVLDDQSRHYMDNISRAARKMSLLIDDLLSFSRMGRYDMSFKPVDLEPLVHDVIRDLEPDDLPAVNGDAAMLRIVLSNLIANALKFTQPRQEARIEIGTLPGQASEIVIFVRDNGAGFEMAYPYMLG